METTLSSYSLSDTTITCRILAGFDDITFSEQEWSRLLEKGDTDTVNLTWQWQRSWWKHFGKGKLLLVLAEKNGEPVALAPLFAYENMIFNLCPEDALDFIGDISDPAILDSILITARDQVENFSGFRFYFIPDSSQTGSLLREASTRMNLDYYDEGFLPSPFFDIRKDPDGAVNLTRKKSLRRHENYFQRTGLLEVLHFQNSEDILEHLDDFFNQHIRRRAKTPQKSIFNSSEQQDYYKDLTRQIAHTGWLRFTRINWNNRAIAFHYGLCYKGRYLFGIPTFEIELSEHSPGEVLLRQLLLAAIAEDAITFDFGIGDEPYKYRFSNNSTKLHNLGLYSRPSA